jgi:asparagine synthase (glutamine-hydrolysing)
MSGIVGMLHLDESPVDRKLLQQMTEAMRFRGPDAQKIWTDGFIGLGYALLQTTDDDIKHQPAGLDGTLWIIADARIDNQAHLQEKLFKTGSKNIRKSSDCELILIAYQKWGPDCVHHLMGDYAFAIWDKPRSRLFCARDHFGIKPFFYVWVGNTLVFGNTIDCLRMHPEVSGQLSEQAIANYLLFGCNVHQDLSFFADIKRLPPAHTLLVSPPMAVRKKRFWQQPVENMIRYNRSEDYVERFRDLMQTAVSDRLRTPQAGVLMSGGLDSTTVAVTARKMMKKKYGAFELCAFTFIYDWLIPDTEGKFAGLAADAMGMPIHFIALDDFKAHRGWDKPQAYLAVSGLGPRKKSFNGLYPHAKGGIRIGLTGQGGDAVLHPAFMPLVGSMKSMRLAMLVMAAAKYWILRRKLPAVGLRTYSRRHFGRKKSWDSIYPPWFNKDLEKRLQLSSQWKTHSHAPEAVDTIRVGAHQALASPIWDNLFEAYDPGSTTLPIELRHPFFDIRLVSFCLALPPIPWCVDKEILRQVNRNRLPESVRRRPKTPLSGFPEYEGLIREKGKQFSKILADAGLERFIDIEKYMGIANSPEKLRPGEYYLISRPLILAGWLKQVSSLRERRQTDEITASRTQSRENVPSPSLL